MAMQLVYSVRGAFGSAKVQSSGCSCHLAALAGNWAPDIEVELDKVRSESYHSCTHDLSVLEHHHAAVRPD
eukprot:351780-Rhodomonas_salina.1